MIINMCVFQAYGFDVYKSSPADVMHFMSNVVRFVVGRQYDVECNNEHDYDLKLREFPWLKHHRDRRRVPRRAVKYTSWKTDECQIFAYPAGENVVDGGVLPEDSFSVFGQLARMVERCSTTWIVEVVMAGFLSTSNCYAKFLLFLGTRLRCTTG